MTPEELNLPYLEGILAFLRRDRAFSPAAAAAILDAHTFIQGVTKNQPIIPDTNAHQKIRRILNTIRHILLTETGKQTADWDFINPSGHLDPSGRRIFPGMIVYLEDIRSPFNVGAMFRTAESFGVERIYVSPLCADPKHPRAQRTAMGCIDILPWERLGPETADPVNGTPLFSGLPPIPLFALETGGTDIAHFPFPPMALMVVGSEELGVNPRVLAAADASLGRLSIPTYGVKGSLNASVAFGIALQAWAAALVTD
jgi:TrmH family RNA methyltransferase